jgi:hypothetical protein
MRQGIAVANEVVLAELPAAVAAVLRSAASRAGFALESMTNRTYLTYRGEDPLPQRRGARLAYREVQLAFYMGSE